MMNQIAAIKPKRAWLSPGGFLSVVLMAVLPKCPLCFMAYAGVIGIVGIDPFIYRLWILPFTAALAVFTLLILFFQAKRNRRYFAFSLSLLAVLSLLLGKFYLNSYVLVYLALGSLLVSAVWISIPKRPPGANNHCTC